MGLFYVSFNIFFKFYQLQGGYPIIKEIPNTSLLVAFQIDSYFRAAKLDIFDTFQPEKMRTIYSFEEVRGGNNLFSFFLFSIEISGYDVTYNSRRGLLGAIHCGPKIAYHIFKVEDSFSKSSYRVRLLQKAACYAKPCNF